MHKIKFKDVEYSILPDVMAISNFCDELNIKLSEFGVDLFDKPSNIYKFFKQCLVRGMRYDEIENTLREIDYENMYSANFLLITRLIFGAEYMPKAKEGTDEPKATAKKSKKK